MASRPPPGIGIALAAGLLAGCGRTLPITFAGEADLDASSGEPPSVPVGFDAYRQWDRLPYIRFGVRAYMRSTYDRAGGNEAADASHFLRQEADDRSVTLDTAGPGVLYFVRTNHWHGSPWHYAVDGIDHVVTESSTADPNHPVAGSTFEPRAAFPSPLALTWSVTNGADLSWVPIPFEKSLSLAYERTHYGTGYYILHRFADRGTGLSHPIESWDPSAPIPPDVLELLGHAGDDIAPNDTTTDVHEGSIDVPGSGSVVVAELDRAPSNIRALILTVPRERALAFGRSRLRVTWDESEYPSVDAPVALFFGTGTLHNPTGRQYLVKGLPVHVRFDDTTVRLAMFYPMPFLRSARIELVGNGEPVVGVRWHIRTQLYPNPPNWAGYFHATYRDHGVPAAGRDLVLLDTDEVEGGARSWCGSFLGTSFVFSDRANLGTLEGDPRFFFDDSNTPQAYGTGTEEWGGGGDYWGGATMTLPLAGHPVGAPSPREAATEEDQIESAYRFLFADLMPFGKRARIHLEHGGVDESTEHYRTVAYWYGLPSACLALTDTLHVGDAGDEAAHDYRSPTSSPVETLSSRYEWGVDHLSGVEVFPEETDFGRHMTGTSEFTLRIRPDNHGVLLRRKLDYGYPDQTAEVEISDDPDGASFAAAGTWQLAGSNSCVYSNPKEELGATEHLLQTSNRRFREDEFLVAKTLTRGRTAIRVRIRFIPRGLPLYPGAPPADQAWSEYRYWAYSYVMPDRP
jgi:hypothetical protein